MCSSQSRKAFEYKVFWLETTCVVQVSERASTFFFNTTTSEAKETIIIEDESDDDDTEVSLADLHNSWVKNTLYFDLGHGKHSVSHMLSCSFWCENYLYVFYLFYLYYFILFLYYFYLILIFLVCCQGSGGFRVGPVGFWVVPARFRVVLVRFRVVPAGSAGLSLVAGSRRLSPATLTKIAGYFTHEMTLKV